MDRGKLQIPSYLCYVNVNKNVFCLYVANTLNYSFPLIMNIMQFWVVDTIVKVTPKEQQKSNQSQESVNTIGSHENEQAPLLPK